MSQKFESTPKLFDRRELGKMAIGGTIGAALLGDPRSSSAGAPPQAASKKAELTLLCRNATTFTPTKALDEPAFRQFLQRFVDAKLGVYIASGGSGEGHALSNDEIRRVYKIGVEVCKGKVQVNANPPEQNTAQAIIEQNQIAVDSGIEVVNIYGPAGWHGFKPTDQEYYAYFDEVLKAIKHPVAMAPNPVIGYTPRPALIADLTNRYTQVVAINLAGVDDLYYVNLKDALTRTVEIYVPYNSSIHTLALGATGLLGAEANIIPKTFRRYLDLYQAGDITGASRVYADLLRFSEYVNRWHSSSPRWVKMAMKVLKIPGGEGGVRGPYQLPANEEVQKFADGLLRLRIPEIDELAQAAGLRVPA
jgi:4-hydroxy-tetrahydrodipicolinate synthase